MFIDYFFARAFIHRTGCSMHAGLNGQRNRSLLDFCVALHFQHHPRGSGGNREKLLLNLNQKLKFLFLRNFCLLLYLFVSRVLQNFRTYLRFPLLTAL